MLGHEEFVRSAWGNVTSANLTAVHANLQSACTANGACEAKFPVPGPNFQRRLLRAATSSDAAMDLFRLAMSRFAQHAIADAMQWLGKATQLGLDTDALLRRDWGFLPALAQLQTTPSRPPAPKLSAWTFDMHHGAIADHLHKIRYMLLANASVHDFQVTNDCQRDVPTQGLRGWCPNEHSDLLLYPTALTLCPTPNRTRRIIFERIRRDPRVLAADVFICTLPIANCQLFMPLDKPMVLVTCFQFHYGRQRNDYYRSLLADLRRLARDPKHVLAASHFYDVEYTRFYTGIEIEYLPLLAAYVNTTYTPMNSVFLIGNYRAPKVCPELVERMLAANAERDVPFDIMAMDQYFGNGGYKWNELAAHPGIVYFPYGCVWSSRRVGRGVNQSTNGAQVRHDQLVRVLLDVHPALLPVAPPARLVAALAAVHELIPMAGHSVLERLAGDAPVLARRTGQAVARVLAELLRHVPVPAHRVLRLV